MPHKPSQIYISAENWSEAKNIIKNGIVKKLSAAKRNIEIDKEIVAVIYIYALEEFGKFLLLNECQVIDDKYIVKYRDEFLNHNTKFRKAFDYLQDIGYSKCIILNDEGSFSPDAFSWKSFTIGLLAETEARLGIFYVDFIKSENDKYYLLKIPKVDSNKLNEAIDKLELVIARFQL